MKFDTQKLGMRSQWPDIRTRSRIWQTGVYFGDDSCNDITITIIWILVCMPLIAIENVYCCCDLDRGHTDLGDACKVVIQ